MIRSSIRIARTGLMCSAALAAFCISALMVSAQEQAPTADESQAAAPSAPAPAAAPAFPKPDPANFTATVPTKQTVDAFLQANWGYGETRIWQVQAIQKTPVDNISRVTVLIGDKTGKMQTQALIFFALPDGKHIITGDQVLSFGERPFDEYRAKLQQRATGPFRGSPNKDLELVEFADFQCPHCKAAQANMEKLSADYPQARFVYQPFPLHPASTKAAEYGLCVAKLAGNSAFFAYSAAVFDSQDALATDDGATMTINGALAKVGVDQAKATACASSPETKAAIKASADLANDLGINEVPMLAMNGRLVPASAPYETLKKIIDFQIKFDGLKK